MYSLLPLLCLCSAWTKATEASDPNLPFMEYLDPNYMVCLKWGFDDPRGTITFKLVVNTTGWVGLGFNSNEEMTGSDIVMGGVGPSESYFQVSQRPMTTDARGDVGFLFSSLNITGENVLSVVFLPIRITTPRATGGLWWTTSRATLSSLWKRLRVKPS